MTRADRRWRGLQEAREDRREFAPPSVKALRLSQVVRGDAGSNTDQISGGAGWPNSPTRANRPGPRSR